MKRKHLIISREDLLVFLALLFNVIDFGVAMAGIFVDPYGKHADAIAWMLVAFSAMVLMFTLALCEERYGNTNE